MAYTGGDTVLKPRRQTRVGVTDVLLLLQLCFLCFTSLQARRFTTYVQVCVGVSPGLRSGHCGVPQSANPAFASRVLHRSPPPPPPPTSGPSLRGSSLGRPPPFPSCCYRTKDRKKVCVLVVGMHMHGCCFCCVSKEAGVSDLLCTSRPAALLPLMLLRSHRGQRGGREPVCLHHQFISAVRPALLSPATVTSS